MDKKKKIAFKYFVEDGYSPEYVNGALGTLTPAKEIVIDFYHERHLIPEEQIHEVNEDGKLGKVLEENPKRPLPCLGRMVKCGIIVDLESAKKINKFLDGQIKALEKIQ